MPKMSLFGVWAALFLERRFGDSESIFAREDPILDMGESVSVKFTRAPSFLFCATAEDEGNELLKVSSNFVIRGILF